MGIGTKELATFLLGAAAALAAKRYMDMTPEEKQKLAGDLKAKAQQMKTDAENATDKAGEYFDELKEKGGEALKEHFPDVHETLHNLFGAKKTDQADQNADKATPPAS